MHEETEHFTPLDLADCQVPIGCPWGADCPEDAFPNHHGKCKSTPKPTSPAAAEAQKPSG